MKALSSILCLALLFTLTCGVCYAKPKRQTVVPKIARILGIRVGYNGRDVLERRFGKGKYSVSGHPNGGETWRVLSPQSVIETDGFAMNAEGEVIESLSWGLEKSEKSIPAVRRLSRRSGWMGKVKLGMTMQQVERLTRKILPPPTKKGDVWTWKARGYVRPSNPNGEAPFEVWTATLTFARKHLREISVSVSGA